MYRLVCQIYENFHVICRSGNEAVKHTSDKCEVKPEVLSTGAQGMVAKCKDIFVSKIRYGKEMENLKNSGNTLN